MHALSVRYVSIKLAINEQDISQTLLYFARSKEINIGKAISLVREQNSLCI